MTAEMIIDFIKRNKGSKPGEAAAEDDAVETDAIAEEATEAESVKDELWARRCVNTEALCFISKLKHVFYRKASLLPWLIKEMDPVRNGPCRKFQDRLQWIFVFKFQAYRFR
jgi:hypothetical protein